jgi:hypothetical protein
MAQVDSNPLVNQVARLIRTFDREQIMRLVELVPELQTIHSEKLTISTEQAELADYFDRQFQNLSAYPPMQDDDPFVGELTVAEFFALPEVDQDRIWSEAHLEAEDRMGDQEQDVQPDALPAR